jgi:hypothetical protein
VISDQEILHRSVELKFPGIIALPLSSVCKGRGLLYTSLCTAVNFPNLGDRPTMDSSLAAVWTFPGIYFRSSLINGFSKRMLVLHITDMVVAIFCKCTLGESVLTLYIEH